MKIFSSAKKVKTKFIVLLCFLLLFSLVALFSILQTKKSSPCDGRQWENPGDYIKCHFPDPPIGRWKAVYTKDFAHKHSLPVENISDDLTPGVDYMEMDVQPYNNGLGTACLVNMLIQRPNDVAMYYKGREAHWGPALHDQRKLTHFLNLEEHKDKLKDIGTFGLAPRNMKYDSTKTYGIGSSFGFYAENILEGYDYITADAGCYYLLSNEEKFPDGWGFNIAKASVWGKYKARYNRMEDVGRPKGKDFFDSRVFIHIPHELVSSIFKDMPIGGQ